MDVSVIMINYNTFELTKNALDSIFEYTSGLEYEIVLIDNNSPDGSGEKLKAHFGDRIKYIQAGANLGTSKSFNLGLRAAGGRYVLWLNTDILIKENFIKKLFDYMESNPRCGICGGNVLDFNGRPAHSFRKAFPSLWEEFKSKSLIVATFRKIFKRPFFNEYNYSGKPMKVGYITGADMMIRSDVLDKVGGFDEDIFMYSEEVEFTWRAVHNAGAEVISVPDAHIFHLEGASFGEKKFNERRFRAGVDGSVVMYTKCYGAAAAEKFLKMAARSYLKFCVIATVLFMSEAKVQYAKKRAIVKQMLKKISA